MNSIAVSSSRTGRTPETFAQALLENLYFEVGSAIQSASAYDLSKALSLAVRDHLTERWAKTTQAHYAANPKFVYYLSAEYLLGKQLPQNVLYTDTIDLARAAVADIGGDLNALCELDPEPGLGNGGLGRLAACFIDSLATLDIPAVGYGLRYEYGIFNQSFQDGWQVEGPDGWLTHGYPWDFAQTDDMVEVGLYGHTEHYLDEHGAYRVRWIPQVRVLAEPYHTLVPGYGTTTVNLLRLWRARATAAFDFELFDTGDYARAVAEKVDSENITKVLYPNDNMPQGKELRLKQQYFFVAASLHDIIRRFRLRNYSWDDFPQKVAIQLNDTHPVIAIPELMRILMDEQGLGWDQAWDITQRTFAYTCHTLMPEALEKWPVGLVQHMLPRHLEIIYAINHRFLSQVRARFPDDEPRVIRMSIIEEGDERQVRMAHLATVGCYAVNGVAELQSELLRTRTLRDFADLWPERFQNKTNGVSPRRFMRLANPRLSDLITSKLGAGWINDLERLSRLEDSIDDPEFRAAWRAVKRQNKQDLATLILARQGIAVAPDSMFDIMVKRLHEYKRQLLQALHIITLYQRIKARPDQDIVPRTFIFGAKAAPGYYMAKLIIKLINNVASVVNHDAQVGDRLKVVFLANFNVSLAQHIYPAADVSEQISLAGKEASGTGNMKFALNGAITIGTLDGANIEIRERVGAENFFLFGLDVDQVFALKEGGYSPRSYYQANAELMTAIDSIAGGYFSGGDTQLFKPIVESLLNQDEFLLLADYASFIQAQTAVDAAFRDSDRWTRMSIRNVARCGYFSSDRTIREYCDAIWRVSPVPVE
jgi:starch phosphorylase